MVVLCGRQVLFERGALRFVAQPAVERAVVALLVERLFEQRGERVGVLLREAVRVRVGSGVFGERVGATGERERVRPADFEGADDLSELCL